MTAGAFTSVRTEGGLLPVDLLRRVSLLDPELPGLRPEDYGLAPGEKLTDAIVRSWNRLVPLWERFAERLEALPDSETSADTQTRNEWTRWLLEELGYPKLVIADPVVIEDKAYPITYRFGPVAVHAAGARVDLDHRPKLGGRAPHSMVQELLNRDDRYLWALVTNGLHLRVLRDSSALTRQAYCDFDVQAIFSGQLYAEFALLWLVCHATRIDADPPSSCVLQQWSEQARTEGVRALDQLREGVEKAIEALGSGLLTPTNRDLREKLRAGDLSTDDFQRQLLRLVYRLLFLLVAEARELLNDPDDAAGRERYRRSYSMERLVDLARRQRGSLHHDLWASLEVTFAALAGPGAPALGLTGLGSFLWSPRSLPDLQGAVIPNRALLDAVYHLTTFEVGGVRRRVDYKNLGADELGGIYESLLETHATVDLDGQQVSLEVAAGNERKTTGSYYTPTPLIRVLLDSALDPVLDEAERADDPEAALLAVSVCDPAVGSGHFLLAAANRIAHRLASVRAGDTEPSPVEIRHALRDTIGHCLYGIDVNPLSVELCKVSLWIEATEPGKPLSFLDHRIVCGNSLLGTTPALVEAGVPDDAFKALTGDDKAVVSALKKQNKAARAGQLQLDLGTDLAAEAGVLADRLADIDALPDDTAEQIADKERRHAELLASGEAERLRLAADAWCAAFVNRKAIDEPEITTDTVRRCLADPSTVATDVRARIEDLRDQYRFLHLHVAFPDVFAVAEDPTTADNPACGWNGGFTVVLGNPPWERVKLQEKEWFATRDPDIASAPNAAARKRLIAALVDEHPDLHEQFQDALRQAEGESHLLRSSGRYPLGGRGDVNTYAVFAELMRNGISTVGRVGVVVPSGIATDDTTKHFFADLVDRHSLVSLYDFENRRKLFPGIDSRIKFCLLTLTGDDRPADDAEFVFFALTVDDLDDDEKRFTLTPDDFALLNPNTRTCPVFRSRRDAEITKGIYRRVPVLVKEGDPDGNPWGVSFSTMFHMSNDSHLFRTREELEADGWILQGNHFVRGQERYLPLYEGRLGHQFNHRFAQQPVGELADVPEGRRLDPTFLVEPQYWVAEADYLHARRMPSAAWLGFRRVARNTDERTVIGCFVPGGPASYGWIITTGPGADGLAILAAAYNSFVFDYGARNALSQPSFPQGTFAQLPVPAPLAFAGLTATLLPLSLELTYTAWDMEPFANDLGFFGPPFRWDPERRALLRAELDALMFHLYGIERDDVDYIMETFPIVKRKDEAEFGEYRTKRLILERYDAMAEAEAAGQEYETILDPPPADPSLCHPESTRPDWAKPRTTS